MVSDWFSPDKTNWNYTSLMGVFCHLFSHCGRCLRLRDISKKKQTKIAQSKAADSGRKEKSRHVQEPPRKHGKCIHLLKNKIKAWKISVLSVFPVFAVITCDRCSQSISRCFVYELESVSKLTELVHHVKKLRQFLNWGKHRKWQSVLTPLIKTFKFLCYWPTYKK